MSWAGRRRAVGQRLAAHRAEGDVLLAVLGLFAVLGWVLANEVFESDRRRDAVEAWVHAREQAHRAQTAYERDVQDDLLACIQHDATLAVLDNDADSLWPTRMPSAAIERVIQQTIPDCQHAFAAQPEGVAPDPGADLDEVVRRLTSP